MVLVVQDNEFSIFLVFLVNTYITPTHHRIEFIAKNCLSTVKLDENARILMVDSNLVKNRLTG